MLRRDSRWAQSARLFTVSVAGLLLALPALASPTEPSPDAAALFLEQNQDALKQLAAEYLSNRFDFLDVKYLQPDAPEGEDGWAVAYHWDAEKSAKQVGVHNGRFTIRNVSYSVNVDGNIAFGNATNTSDLSTAMLTFRLDRGDLGRLHTVSSANSVAFQDCLAKISDPTDVNDEAAWRKVQQAEDLCWAKNGIDRIVKGTDSAYYYWLDFHGGIEGNQDYSETHSLFGFNLAAAFQPTAEQAKYNVVDWPFRLIRSGFDTGSNYVAPLPSVRLSVEQLDASDDSRYALTTDTKFTRATGELAFQTTVASFEGRPVRFTISYRYFYEFDAPTVTKQAGEDRFSFTSASLRFPADLLPLPQSSQYEFFVSYNQGHLPFDQAGDNSYEIGISTNIKLLGALLSK
jgi:hypothetical protein